MSEKCKICGCGNADIIYHGPIKTGLLSGYTDKDYPVYQCKSCKTIWNHAQEELDAEFYESTEYRNRIEGNSEIETYYDKHDKEVLDKLNMTGTDIFRGKNVADIGCGGGSFLDFVSHVAKKIIAIEPSRSYSEYLKEKGYYAYQYAADAINDWEDNIDVVTSFDVIEHVSDPQKFANDMYQLCAKGGKIICGTPTDYPVLRKMLGESFDKFIFQVQHPWILSKESMKLIFENAGFKNIEVRTKQKYGLGNLVAWLSEGKPRGDIKYDFISETVDSVYKTEMGQLNPEYIVVYAEK